MLATLIILVVLAVAIAPLVQFLPSKKQRITAQLREYAAVNGLFVEFRDTPGHAQVLRHSGIQASAVIYYGKRLPAARGASRAAVNWVHDAQGWHSIGKYRAAPAQLLDLPGAVVAASVDEFSCGVYWVETQAQEDVEQIRRALEAWSGDLI